MTVLPVLLAFVTLWNARRPGGKLATLLRTGDAQRQRPLSRMPCEGTKSPDGFAY